MHAVEIAQMWSAIDKALISAVACRSLSTGSESQGRLLVHNLYVNCLGSNGRMWDYLINGAGRVTQTILGMEVLPGRKDRADATFPRSLERIPGAFRGLSVAEIGREEAYEAGLRWVPPAGAVSDEEHRQWGPLKDMFKRMELEVDADWMRNRERQYASVKALSFLDILEKVKRTSDAVSKLEHLLVAARAEIAAPAEDARAAAEDARAFSIAAGAAKLIYETASAKAKEAAAAARISSSTIRVKRHRSKRRASELKGLKSDIKRQTTLIQSVAVDPSWEELANSFAMLNCGFDRDALREAMIGGTMTRRTRNNLTACKFLIDSSSHFWPKLKAAHVKLMARKPLAQRISFEARRVVDVIAAIILWVPSLKPLLLDGIWDKDRAFVFDTIKLYDELHVSQTTHKKLAAHINGTRPTGWIGVSNRERGMAGAFGQQWVEAAKGGS
jgi:hypothetical protein